MPKKPEYIKTPGFIIEVPKDRRKGFFTAPKSPLVYWAFKNRPRVFISEKLIFTFNGKPVAEALVAKVEGPSKSGEGEYHKWHKVFWKPVSFKRFRVAAEDVLYHVALAKNLDDILENGLKAEYGYQFFNDVPKSTYLTDKRGLSFWQKEIAGYYGDPQVVLKVNRNGLRLIIDEQGTEDSGAPAYRVEQDIPPSMIKVAATVFAPKVADHDLETDSGETYWAGEGNGASGILPVCPQKGTVCLAWRSQYVQSPDCWGTIGGAIQSGKSPQGSAKTELAEETGYTGGITLIPAYVFTDGGFTYHNYIGVVGSQFSFAPKKLSPEEYMVLKSKLRPNQYHQLIPGWETDHIEWVPYATVLDDINENPEDYHPGMLKLFKNSKDAIERALGIKEEEPQQEPEQGKTSAFDSSWMKPWVEGKCWQFAIALSHRIPDATFVGLEQRGVVHHVGLKKGDQYYDVRGMMDADTFNYGADADEPFKIVPMDYDQVMRDGEYGSWIGYEDEFNQTSDMKEAVKAVRRVFGGKTADKNCPSGKKKFFDETSAIGLHKKWDKGTPTLRAYKCDLCGWYHLTSKAPFQNAQERAKAWQEQQQRQAAEQGHLFPSSQDAKFRQWFEGSKVVDQAGRPMPVFHGTRSSVDFDTFAVDGPPTSEDMYEEPTSSGSGWDPTAFLGAHFAEESRVANQFAQGEGWTKSRYEGESESPRVIQVFLRITNPKDFGTESNLHNFIYQGKISDDEVLGIACRVETGYNPWEGDDDEAVQKEIEQFYQKYDNDQAFRAKENEYLMQQYRPMDMEDDMLRNAAYDLAMQARHRMEQSGVDGIRYKNEIEGGHAWIAFAPQQIKSVNSQFNPQDQRFVASEDKEADWKSKLLLPGALALGLGSPSMSPATLTPQQQQQQVVRTQEAQAEKLREAQLDKLVEAISRAEGAKPELNNPGNVVDFNTGEIRAFDSYEQGRDALETQLNRIADGVHPRIKPDMTLREAGLIYSNGDPNWAHNVSLIMHVPQSIKMEELIKGRGVRAQVEQPSQGKSGAWLKKAAGFAFRSFKKLWHVGDMNSKSKQPGSLEGNGLSVSIHPEEWMAIAEIGGDTWELTKAGNTFLNFHRISKQQRKAITAWGVAQGYVEEIAIGWRWVYFDSEADEERFLEFETEEEARAEMDGQGEGEVVPSKGSSMKGTEKLKQRTLNPRADDMVVAYDLLVTVYADEELACDGVWWEDTFDPAGLSAPRGVIFTDKLSSWKARKVRRGSLSYNRDKGGILWAKDPELALTAVSIPDELPENERDAYAIGKLQEQKVMADKLRKSLKGSEWKHVPVNDEWLKRAKVFLKEKWAERHKELGREGIPTDLAGACKFASMFAQKIFGGQMVGNADHQVLKHVGRIIDLTDLYDPNTLRHDKDFWLNPEHEESLKSCEPRVQQWVDEFMKMYWNDAYMKTGAEIYLYHGTSALVAEKIMLGGGVMEAGSYWGTERIADTYAEEAVDAELEYEAEAEQAIFRIPLSRFNKANLKPDENSVAEPLTYTLKRKEDDLYAEWEAAQGTWEDSLRIYESVRYDAPINVTKADRLV